MLFGEFIEKLEREGRLVRIKKPVSREYEMASIMRKIDKPIIFENVNGSEFPVAANMFSSKPLVAMGLGMETQELIPALANAIDNPTDPVVVEGDYKEIGNDLEKLPILTHYKKDGGPYMSSSIVIVNDKEHGLNASYHRMMVIGNDKLVMRILPRHFNEYIERGLKEFAICIGPQVQVQVCSGISCELGKSELSIANSLKRTEMVEVEGHVVPKSEFVIIAEFTGELASEGPFVDLTGTYDIVRNERVARIKKIFARPNAVYHALLPGGNEHKVLMGMPKEPTILREVNKVCNCLDVNLSPGGCSWLHGIVKIEKQGSGEGKKAIEAAFLGHKSMKHVFVVDKDIDIYSPEEVEWAISTRFQGNRDLIVKPGEKGSSLDPSSNLETRETCKVGFDLTIHSDRNKTDFERAEPEMKIKPEDYL